MIKITDRLLTETAEKASQTERKRCNHNFHSSPSDSINRLINAMEKGAYFPPHKHENPDKREIFLIFRGRVLMVEFDGNGRVIDHIILDSKEGNFGVEIQPRTWHSLIPLDEVSVLYEIKDGPYDKKVDKTFPEWAPAEGEEGVEGFIKKVLEELKIEA